MMIMKASVGDQLVVLSAQLDRPVRAGEIVEIHGRDGEPPFLVKWGDSDHTTLVCPGPDARVLPQEQISAG
jgi:hypothetical protein